MTILMFGLLLFIGTHLIPAFPKLRENIILKLKPSAYKALFSIFSLVSILLIIVGLK